MSNDQLTCPVDFVTVNEWQARITAGFVFLLTVIFLFAPSWPIPVFLVLDFFVRGFKLEGYSLLSRSAAQLIRTFHFPAKPTDRAPKRFAARIGFAFSLAIAISFMFDQRILTLVISLVMATFALLEAAFSFCAGCHAFTLYNKFAGKKP